MLKPRLAVKLSQLPEKFRPFFTLRKNCRCFFTLLVTIFVTACSSNDDDGGLIGTGTGIIDSSGFPAYQLLTMSTPATQEPAQNGMVMNFAPMGSIEGVCPTLLVSTEVDVEAVGTSEWESPAAGFIGNWLGSTSRGDDLVIVFTEDDVAHGNRNSSLSLRSNTALQTLITEATGTRFSYTVTLDDESASSPDTFSERFELIAADSMIYSIENSAFGSESVQLNRQQPTELLAPPLWLQATWVDECESRVISSNNILVMSTRGSVDIASLINTQSSTFRVNNLDDTHYRYTATFRTEDGDLLRVSEQYELVQPQMIDIVSGSVSRQLSRQ